MALCPSRNEVIFLDWLHAKLLEERNRLNLELRLHHESLLAEIVKDWLPKLTACGVEAPADVAQLADVSSRQSPACTLETQGPGAICSEEKCLAIVPEDAAEVGRHEPLEHSVRITSETATTREAKNSDIPRRGTSLKKLICKPLSNVQGAMRSEHAKEMGDSAILHGRRPVAGSYEFELISGLLIAIAIFLSCLELHFNGFIVGRDTLGIEWYAGKDWKTINGILDFIHIANIVFNTLFTFEIILRVIDYKWAALKQMFIWFDGVIVCGAWIQLTAGGSMTPMILRVFRLSRIIRLVRLMNVMVGFRTLFLLIRSIHASFGVLVWTIAIVGSVQIASGMFVNQLLRVYIENEANPIDDRLEVFEYFGTFTTTLFTMFEITDANWVTPTRMLMKKVNIWWGLYFVLYRCFLFFSLGRIIAAVFISETNRINEQDFDLVSMKKSSRKEEYEQKMWELFQHFGVEAEALLTRKDCTQMLTSSKGRMCRELFGIDIHKLDDIYDLLENKEGFIHVEAFIEELPKLKNGATSLEVISLRKHITNILGPVLTAGPISRDLRLGNDTQEMANRDEGHLMNPRQDAAGLSL